MPTASTPRAGRRWASRRACSSGALLCEGMVFSPPRRQSCRHESTLVHQGGRHAHRAGGEGRAEAPGRRDRPPRCALLPAGRTRDQRRRIRRAARAQRGHRGALPGAAARRQPFAARRRHARRGVRQGAPRRADALARQCLRRRGSGRFHRPRPALPGARARRPHRGGRGAEDRRAFHLADLRGRPAWSKAPHAATASRARTSPPTS